MVGWLSCLWPCGKATCSSWWECVVEQTARLMAGSKEREQEVTRIPQSSGRAHPQ
jgi:hypothetical protein